MPRLLDLYCGAGGASMGYSRAGFDIVGVDLNHQPNYPFEFIRSDAIDYARRYGHLFDAVHASPPCQSYSTLTRNTNKSVASYSRLIEPTRLVLDSLGIPYVIENVAGSEVRKDLMLCGEMFGLEVVRHRYFELGGWSVDQPGHKLHRGRVKGWRNGKLYDGPYFMVYGTGARKGSVSEWQRAMGIDWTRVRHEIAEAIPPAYTEFIGLALLDKVSGDIAA